MRKLSDLGDLYAQNSTWKDFALIKFCLCAMGVIIGVLLPSGAKRIALTTAVVIFTLTYIPLMYKLFQIVKKGSKNDD